MKDLAGFTKGAATIQQHLVFGYGSLICSESRAITAPTLAQRPAIPVAVQGLQRTWSKPSNKMGMTAMGIRWEDTSECTGVLLLVNEEELQQLDQREIGYTRKRVPVQDVQTIPYLDAQKYYKYTPFLMNGHDNDNEVDQDIPDIWVYVQDDPVPASEEHPIAQSYVDIILRGCLEYSPKFAQEFVLNTAGWHPSELQLGNTAKEEDDDDAESWDGSSSPSPSASSPSFHWVDDREDPLYVRADMDYSKAYSRHLDRLLSDHVEDDLFDTRIPIAQIQQ